MKNLVRLLTFLKLDIESEDKDIIYEEIKKSAIFVGSNLWILIFAILIASIGLNMNSVPVIIGAMLISPLMGPINAIGYGLATYDFELLKLGLRNLLFAVIASILISTIYFMISPISEPTNELIARTSPTIYDVLVALFGGLAGIISVSTKSRNKINVIAGVAIATALMPPLATAGYGLSKLNFQFFFGALYLFIINATFIAISSVLVSKLLKFPIKSSLSESRRKYITRLVSVIIVIVLAPSLYLAYLLIQKEQFIQKSKLYISAIENVNENYLIRYDIKYTKREIDLLYFGELNDSDKKEIIEKAKDFNLNAKINVLNVSELRKFREAFDKQSEMIKLKEQISLLNTKLQDREKQILELLNRTKISEKIFKEIKMIYPEIKSISYAKGHNSDDSTTSEIDILIVSTSSKISDNDKQKIENFLKLRLERENLKIFFLP